MDALSIKNIVRSSLVGLSLTACASGPSVQPQLTQTAGAVRAAEEVGAQQLPPAALHLKLAHENLDHGKALAEEDENEEARRALERASIDAELAIALVKEDRAQKELDGVKSELQDLNTKHGPQQ